MILLKAGLFSQNRQFNLTDPGISGVNQILVSAENPTARGLSYKTLILGSAASLEYRPLTIYPGQSAYYPDRNELRIYNHYGLFQYRTDKKTWETASFLPSFRKGVSVSPLSLLPLYDSPDGRFTVYTREEKGMRISLYLHDNNREESFFLSTELPREFSSYLVKWSPDSKYFIYRRDRELYYYSIEQFLSDRVPAEEFRRIGQDNINSVCWGPGNYLYMMSGKLLFRLHSSEFFTRSFYSDPFQKGTVWGRIPVSFDPRFDDFVINPSGTAIFLVKDERDGFVFSLNKIYEESSRDAQQSASLSLPSGQAFSSSAWLDDQNVILLAEDSQLNQGVLYCLDRGKNSGFTRLSDENVRGFNLSPDSRQLALLLESKVLIMDSLLKETVHSFEADSPLRLLWTKDGYYLLGSRLSEELHGGERTVIALSQVDASAFDAENRIICETGGRQFLMKEGLSWIPRDKEPLRPRRLDNGKYRIFLEGRPGGWYAQSLRVREISSFTTGDLLTPFRSVSNEGQPVSAGKGRTREPWYFSHGNSRGRREVSLVFNAVNSAEGLNSLLKTLSAYGIRSTFFLNGDFINNYPDAARRIAATDHTAASLFYTYFDMSDSRYQITREFLKKGLARNEDDYYMVTGRELALLWHTPYYYLNRDILDISGLLNYTFIGKELDVSDWLGKGSSASAGRNYSDTVPLIESLLKKVTPGAVIPITLGRFAERDDYLYRELAMLIEGLILMDYEIVPLEELMDETL